jgi:serine/threonine-protein kinase
MPINPGSRIGPYEISGLLGKGGMGEVYRAHDARLNRDVAVKTLPSGVYDDQNRMARFQREAQVLAALNHPHIAAVYGLEDSAGARALVMELVEGTTLAERIAAGPIPIDEALAIARQISSALDAAHEKGIVHRDLKPANIKLTPDGKVKVLDFGLAKAYDAEAASGSGAGSDPVNSPTLTLEATRAGVLLGTAAYMSPEQARGKPVDKRADIWAFGVVLYEMLTGRIMFEGDTLSDTLAGVLRAPIDFQGLPAATSPAVRRLLERCLERDPKRRLRDMGDAWIEIDAPIPAPAQAAAAPAKPSPLRWLPWAATVIVGGAGIAWGLLHTPAIAPAPVVRWSYAQEKPFLAVTLSRDGSRMAYLELDPSPRLSLRMTDQLEAKPIPGGEFGTVSTFSPDGQWIAFFQGQSDLKVKKIPASGGTAITLCDAAGPFGLDWGADDSIVFSGAKGLMRVSASGGTPEALTTLDTKKNETAHRWPSILPGGQYVLFTIRSGASSQVAVLDVKTRAIRVLAPNGSSARYLPTGHLVYYRSGTLFAAGFDAKRAALTGSEAPVVENVSPVVEDGADYAVADSGTLLYLSGAGSGGKTTMNWADRKGALQQITDAQEWGTGRLSPDGTRIANGIHSGSNEDIWTFEFERRTRTRLTFEGVNQNPIWTPDGKWITFSSKKDKFGISRVAADASGKPEVLLETDAVAIPHSWSPDGKTLVYSHPGAGTDKKLHLWAVTLPGGKPMQLHDTPFSDGDGQISPDGHWLAYQSMESGTLEIYVQPFPGPGAKTRISSQSGNRPRWSRNGKELLYWTTGATLDLMSVDVQTGAAFHAGAPQSLFKLAAGTTWDIAPDGKRFLVELSQGMQEGRKLQAVVNWFDELRRRVPLKK